MELNRWRARSRRRTAPHAGTASTHAGTTNVKAMTAVTLAAVVLGYAVGGSATAAVGGFLTFLTFPAVAVANALVQYLKAGTLQETPGPPVVAAAAEPRLLAVPGPAAPTATAPFWDALTPAERHDLTARARRHLYRAEEVLCREGGVAGEVIVILSGWTRVWVHEGAEQRIIAFRGAGEVVGERAALVVRDRSATVTAESDVQALRVGAREFGAFLDLNPRVRAVLEQQVYRRQVEKHAFHDVRGNCSILITDITRFSSPVRTDADREYVLSAMYDLMGEAFTASGLDLGRIYQEDRGDGALVVVPPTTPTDAVVDPMLAHLAAELRRHNRRAAEATRLQLRAALHVGPVQRGPKGVAGTAIITTRRMVDAPAVKRRVAETGADLAFVTSDFVYDTVIAPAPGLVDPNRYSRVRVRLKEASLSAWLMLEGGGSRLRAV
ncbi:Cyclic nucleotide-binding domain-containing protein [Actinomadura meyerae]|uniref:Cyclic nucleotide-binding domain-containing protein n=1 Tax=Actinomadura meyerae TaxID=240840 RepID=A0A239E5V0_9ACTN|nr:cyclic nucleotide-binding domain-containing protein [Actinomadura meyerae]SNS40036.1 Cyclic nucleotide-binding domain-containing protein [Actinomadura meyerae]